MQSGCGPQIHFYNWLSRYLENGEVVTGNYEYRGHTSEIVYPDQFGDHLPVGAPACARRGCSGCWYCKGVPLPVMLEVDISGSGQEWAGILGTGIWVSRPATPFGDG